MLCTTSLARFKKLGICSRLGFEQNPKVKLSLEKLRPSHDNPTTYHQIIHYSATRKCDFRSHLLDRITHGANHSIVLRSIISFTCRREHHREAISILSKGERKS
jgi:hypothetical protein